MMPKRQPDAPKAAKRPRSVTMFPTAEGHEAHHDLDPTESEAALRADAGQAHPERDRMIALVRRFLELGNADRPDELDEVFARDVVDHDAFPGQVGGLQGFRDAYAQYAEAFPDLNAQPGEPLVEGDRVAFAVTFTGTHRGPLLGVAPTERRVCFGGLFMFRVKGGRVVDSWGSVDGLDLLAQLGAAPWQRPTEPEYL